jgi:hypothetical protein
LWALKKAQSMEPHLVDQTAPWRAARWAERKDIQTVAYLGSSMAGNLVGMKDGRRAGNLAPWRVEMMAASLDTSRVVNWVVRKVVERVLSSVAKRVVRLDPQRAGNSVALSVATRAALLAVWLASWKAGTRVAL